MTTSPTLTTHYLAEPAPRQHAFPHSANTSEEEMEEKENVNQNLHISSDSEQCLFSAWLRQDDKRALALLASSEETRRGWGIAVRRGIGKIES